MIGVPVTGPHGQAWVQGQQRLQEMAAAVARERIAGPPRSHGIGEWRGGAGLTRGVTAVLAADARVGFVLAHSGVHAQGLSRWAVCRRRRDI